MYDFRYARVWLVALCILQSAVIAPVFAQENKVMLETLLRPTGWRAEWTGPGGSGITEVMFLRQGDTVTAKIRLVLPIEMVCENPVKVESTTVSFDGCRDPGLKLHFDPTDRDIPFRGSTPRGYEWKLRPK
jgi:hypothetical protein